MRMRLQHVPRRGCLPAWRSASRPAALLPQGAGSNLQWWDPGVAGRRKMHIEIAPWVYQVTSSAVALPAEEERLYIVAFLPVGKAEAANEVAAAMTDSTLMLKR